jgi:hypothetical protein
MCHKGDTKYSSRFQLINISLLPSKSPVVQSNTILLRNKIPLLCMDLHRVRLKIPLIRQNLRYPNPALVLDWHETISPPHYEQNTEIRSLLLSSKNRTPYENLRAFSPSASCLTPRPDSSKVASQNEPLLCQQEQRS